MSDALVAAIAAGDADAFADWLRGAERPLRQSLRRYAASVDTEAVLQETLLRVWQVAPRFEPDGRPDGLLRLAHRIAHNLAISEIRKHGREYHYDEDALAGERGTLAFDPPNEPDSLLERLIIRCIETLPAKPLSALLARLQSYGKESDATIAARLNMRKNTFLQNITRARKSLAECLERHGVNLEEEWR